MGAAASLPPRRIRLWNYLPLAWYPSNNTSVSSVALGEEAIGSESMFIADVSRDPSEEEDISMLDLARLQVHVWHVKKR